MEQQQQEPGRPLAVRLCWTDGYQQPLVIVSRLQKTSREGGSWDRVLRQDRAVPVLRCGQLAQQTAFAESGLGPEATEEVRESLRGH